MKNKLEQEAHYLEADQKFLHDKLIALSSAIMGFTAIMLGDDKLQGLNLFLLKISWFFLGSYLIYTLTMFWSSLRWKTIQATRSAMIDIDEMDLENEPVSQTKKEKIYLLKYLKLQEFFNKGFKQLKKEDMKNDSSYTSLKCFYEKYKDDLHTTRYLKKQDFAYSCSKDRIMEFFIYNGEWSYILFGLGMVALIASVF